MKLASFIGPRGASYGLVDGDTLIDLGASLGRQYPDLRSFLAAGAPRSAIVDGDRLNIGNVAFLPVIPNADSMMLALGWAYRDHQIEGGRAQDEIPQMFTKHPRALVGHLQPAIKPRVSDAFDFEGELVVVIGRAGRAIPEARAMEHVAGYTILMDGSVRDFQKHSATAGKNFDRTSPYGPWIVTTDEIPDPHALELTTRLNGETMQRSSTGLLAWRIPYLIHYCSTFTALQPGDAISTGTPGGVGHRRNPPVFLRAGDTLEIEISRIGVLRNPIASE